MMVRGVVLRHVGLWGGNSQGYTYDAKMPSAYLSQDTQLEATTTRPLASEPTPFIQLGSPQVIIATAILSNTTVQDWVWDLLGWSEPTDVQGNPMTY